MQRLMIAAAILAITAASCTGGDSEASTTSTVEDTTTSIVAGSTTSVAPETTTVPQTTTSTVDDTTTTTVPETTTTTTTEPPPTTSMVLATVELSDEGVQAGNTWVHFGFDDEDAIAAITAVLGVPDTDSGWVDSFSVYGTCPGTDIRGVHWGDFVMLFTHADTDFWFGGVPHFFAYYYTNATPDLLTTEGVGIGSSVEMLEAAYGGPSYTMDEAFFDPSVGFWTYDQHTWTGLWGYATGQSTAHVVTSINGGQGCGE